MPAESQHRHEPPTLDRRELLIAVSTLAAALGLPGAAMAQQVSKLVKSETDTFADVSVALTGYAPGDPSLMMEFANAFAPQVADLARLHDIVRLDPPETWDAKIAAAGLSALAEALITAWYTGAVGEGADRRVFTYFDAFAWYAVAYTQPPTRCAEAFGGWALPPHENR